MKKLFLGFVLIAIVFSISAENTKSTQEVSCDELIQFIKQEGRYHGQVSSLSLMQSSWLNEVKAYKYERNIYIIAKIKPNEYSITYKEYVFCQIPQQNWSKFSSAFTTDGSSYGERFHKYIMDYKCNCY